MDTRNFNNNLSHATLLSEIVENLNLTQLDFLSPPYVKDSLYHGAKSITVYGFLLDVTIDVEVDAIIISSVTINIPHPDGVVIFLPKILLKDQHVRIRQRTDEVKSEWSDPTKVIHITDDYSIIIPRPKIHSPIYDGLYQDMFFHLPSDLCHRFAYLFIKATDIRRIGQIGS
jgi:hypothetical protein